MCDHKMSQTKRYLGEYICNMANRQIYKCLQIDKEKAKNYKNGWRDMNRQFTKVLMANKHINKQTQINDKH